MGQGKWRLTATRFLCAAFIVGGALHEAAMAAESSPPAGPLTLTNLWTLIIKGHSDCVPAVASNGTIYLPNFDGKLWAANPDGTRRWVFETRKVGRTNIEIKSSPAIGADGTVFFGCRDERVYAVTPGGAVAWAYKTGGWVDSSPAIGSDGSVYVGSWDKNLYAFTGSGTKKWQFATGGEITSSPSVGGDGLIYFGSHDGKFYAIKSDGTKAWDYTAGASILSSAAIDADGTLYFTSVDGNFHALASGGLVKWKLKTGGATESSPVIGQDGSVFVGVNKEIWRISREGRKVWSHPATYDAYQQPIHSTPCALEDGSLIAVSGYGLLAAYNQKPAMTWRYYLYGFGSGGPAIASDGTIYVAAGLPGVGRAIVALSNTVGMARSPWPAFRGPCGDGRAR